MDYVIVLFPDEGNSVSIIHKTWFVDEEEDQSYWPPAKNSANAWNNEKAMAMRGDRPVPGDGWKSNRITVIGKAGQWMCSKNFTYLI
jgi:hypothetical protein